MNIFTHYVLQEVLNNSDHQAVLQLVNLVAGRYVFTLTVMDTEGLTSSDKASVVVKEGNSVSMNIYICIPSSNMASVVFKKGNSSVLSRIPWVLW